MNDAVKTVMVVDDGPENLKYMQALLKTAQLRVLPAPSGKLALQALAQAVPDLVLLDVHMPEMDGREVLAKIRNELNLAALPVIFVTGSTEPEELAEMRALGCNDILIKPFTRASLLAVVSHYLD